MAPPFYRRSRDRDAVRGDPRRAARLGFRPGSVTAVDNGVDALVLAGRRARPDADGAWRVGRLAPVKRFELLLEAALAARGRARAAAAHRRRGTAAPASCEAWIGDHDAAGWVDAARPRQRDQLRDEYRRAWVVGSASLAEGWGLSLTEAAACGTPAVATDISGHRCSVVDGVTGLLAAPADLGDALAAVLGDDDLRRRLGAAALARARTLTWDARRRSACSRSSRRARVRAGPPGASVARPSMRMRSSCCRPTTSARTSAAPAGGRPPAPCPDADILVVDDNSPDGTGDARRGGRRRARARSSCCAGPASRARQRLPARLRDRPRRGLRRRRVDGRRLLARPGGRSPSCCACIDAGADAVIGSRYVPGGATVDWPLHRRLLSRWGNRYTSLVLAPAGPRLHVRVPRLPRRRAAGDRPGDHDGRGLRLPHRARPAPRARRAAG